MDEGIHTMIVGTRHGRARRFSRVIFLVVALIAILTLAACGGTGSAGPSSTTTTSQSSSAASQTSEGGNVTVEVTWKGKSVGPVFTVAIDTHSVNLDGYDLRQLAVLQTDQGAEFTPTNWDAPKGGHHRTGTLTFSATTPDGTALIGPNTRTIRLIVRNVAGVSERVFQWTV